MSAISLRQLVSSYLQNEAGFSQISIDEQDLFNIIKLLRNTQKVEAIKYLRNLCRHEVSYMITRLNNNLLSQYVEKIGFTRLCEIKTLSLREAKDIVDFIQRNS